MLLGRGKFDKSVQRDQSRRRFLFGILGQQENDRHDPLRSVEDAKCDGHIHLRFSLRRVRR
jgi:hypothetical protein